MVLHLEDEVDVVELIGWSVDDRAVGEVEEDVRSLASILELDAEHLGRLARWLDGIIERL